MKYLPHKHVIFRSTHHIIYLAWKITSYLLYLPRKIIKNLIDGAALNAPQLCRVALSDCFYYTRQATSMIAVISARRLGSNSRGETSSFFKGDFYVIMKETGRSDGGGLEVSVAYGIFWAMRTDRLTEHLVSGGGGGSCTGKEKADR